MRPSGGYGVWVDRESGKTLLERDFVKCRHCQGQIAVKPGSVCTTYLLPDLTRPGQTREEPGAWCPQCGGPICLACHAKGVCTPFMKQIDEAEARQRLVKGIVGVAGA